MSGASSIEWTDATWNPVRGCTRVSEGCRHCYAETLAARNLPGHRSPTTGKPFAERTLAGPRWTGKVELIPHLLDWPLRRRRPSKIFVNSMSDLFHEGLSNEAIAAVFGVMAASPQHTFQVLTKRPERMLAWFEWAARCEEAIGAEVIIYEAALALGDGSNADYDRQVSLLRERSESIADDLKWPLPNVWLGVSVENQATADERIPLLLQTPAAKRFVSYEPALGPIEFIVPFDGAHVHALVGARPGIPPLDWVIVGGESGPGARPLNLAWPRSTVAQCRAAKVACFVKQFGADPFFDTNDDSANKADAFFPGSVLVDWTGHGVGTAGPKLSDRKGGDQSEWPEDLRVQEFPR